MLRFSSAYFSFVRESRKNQDIRDIKVKDVKCLGFLLPTFLSKKGSNKTQDFRYTKVKDVKCLGFLLPTFLSKKKSRRK